MINSEPSTDGLFKGMFLRRPYQILKEDFQASLKNIAAIFLYHSKNDTEVPFEHLEFYENAFTTATVRKLPGKEHIFSKDLPELVSDIKSL